MSSRPVIQLEPVFRVNRASRTSVRWEAEGLETLGLWERSDLQQWFVEELRTGARAPSEFGILEAVVGANEIGDAHEIGGPLLLISEEFSSWGHGGTRHADRLDLLLLDDAGALVVVELKRGVAEEFADLQALRYAAYASTLQPREVEEMLARRLGTEVDEARGVIAEHVDGVSPQAPLPELGPVRIVLVAEGFTAPMTTTAMFLRERKIDVRCVQLAVRKVDDDELAVSPRLLVPPPATEAFLVKRQEQERAEAVARADTRRRARSVDILIKHQVIPPGTELTFAAALLGPKRKPAVEAWLAAEPGRASASWTGDPGARALKWMADGQLYSASELARIILNESLGANLEAVPGPDYWLAPGSQTKVLAVLASEVLGRSDA